MSLFRSLGFQKKMMLSYLVMMLLIGFVATLFSYQMTKVISDETYLTQNVLPKTSALMEVKNQLYMKTYALKMYTLTREPSYLDKYYTMLIDSSRFQPLQQTAGNSELLAIVETIGQLDFLFLNKINPLLKANNLTAVNYVLTEEVQPRIDQLESQLTFSLHKLESQTAKEFQRTNDSLQVSLIVTYSVSVASILFGLFCTFYFRHELLRPIQSLVRQVREVSKGTFGQQIVYTAKDEFHELALEFNKMSNNIAELFLLDQAQRQVLQEEKNVREQILNSLPVGVITRHYQSGEVHINQKAKELVKLDDNFFPQSPDDAAWQTDSDSPWFENRKMTLYKQDGTTFSALVSYVPLENDSREAGWMVALSDITEQEKAQEFIHQSEKLRLVGQLAAGAAHEIRNPLTVIYGFMQLLQQRLSEEERNQYYLPMILQEIERVNLIVTEFLLLSKPSCPNYREVTLHDVLSSILPLMKAEATLHGIEVIDRYERDVRLHVDVEQMKQIILNLMKNSIEAMKQGGLLTLESRHDETHVYISVRDTGEGIPAEYLNRIFEPFFSLKEEGTGLGLPITRRMVENHGGELKIDSKPGVGTEIVISLPIHPTGL
jgi:signal transduction histidine kinase/HAMP domain-containing protein